MKRLIRPNNQNSESTKSKPVLGSEGKLKRTPESGHLVSDSILFDSFEDYMKWWEEDALYED